jgi:hypothetical protein
MLVTPIFNGQGLGNQLACYVTTRCLALDKGYRFGVAFPERFKGHFFKNISMPEFEGVSFREEGQPPVTLPEGYTYYRENADGDYDKKILNVADNTIIHGDLQGEGYFEKHKDKIRRWLEVEPLEMADDLCVINFRGGEYVGVKDFFLPQEYWDNAIKNMRKINPKMRFEVHTDDYNTAKQFFPDFDIVAQMGLNWRSIRYAKYIILSNSSFGCFLLG